MDFTHLNQVYRNALSVWVNELFEEDDSFLFDTRLAAEEDSFGDQASEFWGYLTEANNCHLVEIFHHPDGPHMLDVRRPNSSLRRGSLQQIELAMRYGHLQSVRYFASGDHYKISISTKDANPNSPNTWACQAVQGWSTLEECRDTIDKLLKLNPEHSVDVVAVH